MRFWRTLIPVITLATMVVVACSPAAAPPPATAVPATKADTKASAQDAGAAAKYEALVQEAKKEGKITIVSRQALLRDPLRDDFGKKFGIDVEYLNQAPAAMVAKLKNERQAGQYNVDVALTGVTTLILDMIPDGMLDRLDDVLIQPEV